MSEEIRELGEVAYAGYFKASGGKSLISGADLPSWDEQAPEIRQAWNLGAMDVVDYWREAGDGGERLPDDAPLRYALVEQMGHRATVATIRETTFAGKPMIEMTAVKTGAVHLVAPESLYEITWLSESDALARSQGVSWTAVALPAANPNPWGAYGADDYDDGTLPDPENPITGRTVGALDEDDHADVDL